jgi:hypothetical protein
MGTVGVNKIIAAKAAIASLLNPILVADILRMSAKFA